MRFNLHLAIFQSHFGLFKHSTETIKASTLRKAITQCWSHWWGPGRGLIQPSSNFHGICRSQDSNPCNCAWLPITRLLPTGHLHLHFPLLKALVLELIIWTLNTILDVNANHSSEHWTVSFYFLYTDRKKKNWALKGQLSMIWAKGLVNTTPDQTEPTVTYVKLFFCDLLNHKHVDMLLA